MDFHLMRMYIERYSQDRHVYITNIMTMTASLIRTSRIVVPSLLFEVTANNTTMFSFSILFLCVLLPKKFQNKRHWIFIPEKVHFLTIFVWLKSSINLMASRRCISIFLANEHQNVITSLSLRILHEVNVVEQQRNMFDIWQLRVRLRDREKRNFASRMHVRNKQSTIPIDNDTIYWIRVFAKKRGKKSPIFDPSACISVYDLVWHGRNNVMRPQVRFQIKFDNQLWTNTHNSVKCLPIYKPFDRYSYGLGLICRCYRFLLHLVFTLLFWLSKCAMRYAWALRMYPFLIRSRFRVVELIQW